MNRNVNANMNANVNPNVKSDRKPKKIFTFADESFAHLLLDNILRSAKLEPHPCASLNDLTKRFKETPEALAIIDITFMDDFVKETKVLEDLFPIQRPPTARTSETFSPASLWLTLDPSLAPTLLQHWPQLGSNASIELLPKPLSEGILKLALDFTVAPKAIFEKEALQKLTSHGDLELGRKILLSFNESLKEAYEKTRSACSSGDFDGAVRATHAIKASALLVGAFRLHTLCLWFENKRRWGFPLTENLEVVTHQVFKDTIAFFSTLTL